MHKQPNGVRSEHIRTCLLAHQCERCYCVHRRIFPPDTTNRRHHYGCIGWHSTSHPLIGLCCFHFSPLMRQPAFNACHSRFKAWACLLDAWLEERASWEKSCPIILKHPITRSHNHELRLLIWPILDMHAIMHVASLDLPIRDDKALDIVLALNGRFRDDITKYPRQSIGYL